MQSNISKKKQSNYIVVFFETVFSRFTSLFSLKPKAAFTKPSRGMSKAKGEQESTETLSFRCDCERCHLMRGAEKPSRGAKISPRPLWESGFAHGRNVVSPDSEQIEHTIPQV